MGSERFYPEERPVREVAVEGFWIDRGPVTVSEFRRFVDATGYVTVAERPLDPADFPGADPAQLVPGSLVFRKTRGAGRPPRRAPVVGLRARRHLAATEGPERPTRTTRSPTWLRGRRGLRRLGGQGSCPPRPSGSRGPRRARGRGLRVGRRARSRRPADGQHLAGRVPVAEPARRRLRGNLPGRRLPAERIRAARRHRQRLGVDLRLLRRRGEPTNGLLRATPARRRRSRAA